MTSERFNKTITELSNLDRQKSLEYLNLEFPKPQTLSEVPFYCYADEKDKEGEYYKHEHHTAQRQLNTIVDLIISNQNLLNIIFVKFQYLSKLETTTYERLNEQVERIYIIESNITKIEKSINQFSKDNKDILIDISKESTSKSLDKSLLDPIEELKKRVQNIEVLIKEIHRLQM